MRKEVSPNSKILRKIIIGIAVYAGAFLFSLILLTPFISVFKYAESSVSAISTFIAGFAAFLTITGDEKTLLLYNPKAIFAKKAYFFIFVILTSFAFTVIFNYLYSKIPWDIFGSKHVTQDNETLYSVPLYFRLIVYVVIGPFAEEILFRGVIFSRFNKIIPLMGAVLCSSVFFGVYHGNLMQGTYAFFMGSIMCLMLHYGGSILYPFLFHMIANLISNICYEYVNINNVIYSPVTIILSAAYLVVAIILSFVLKDKLTKKDKKC